MTTAVIVQARWGSSRFPGKILQALGDITVLAHVIERCAAIPGVDVVVIAAPDSSDADPVADEAQHCGAKVFRGSENDVLSRYAGAARMVDAEVVLRVTSDCPLIDPQICGQVLDLRQAESADYASNNLEVSFPHGLDCEAFTAATLFAAEAQATKPDDREHVTPWMRTNPKLKRANLMAPDKSHINERWTLDYPDDLEFLRGVLKANGGLKNLNMAGVIDIVDANPHLADLNKSHRAKRS